ncbi:MAG: ribonuclease HII [Alphaproteobacteria bacterium]|nr:ribonuclease HII [Alphaproteobacteria bacterium]MCL2757963.1 ribonuclease HII [Alphaproteobacteria bacterium]
MKSLPDFSLELESGFNTVAGVDEAGRGPLCGPVVAAAVIFVSPASCRLSPPIADSKKLSSKARAAAHDWIMNNCIVGVGECSPEEIDELNILHASMLAMKRAIANLSARPDFCLVDGNRLPTDVKGRAVVGGDAKSISVAAASIVAKEVRDKIMRGLAEEFPEYGWERNAGYPTASHLQAIKKYGINKHYRKTFSPVAKIIKNVEGSFS